MADSTRPIRVLLASDSFLIGDGLASLFAEVPDLEVVGRARDHAQVLDMAATRSPDVAILSIRSPVVSVADTMAAARRLRADHPDLGLVIISERTSALALGSLRGPRLLVLLDEQLPTIATVIGAVRDLGQGRSVPDPGGEAPFAGGPNGDALDRLTPREMDVLGQIAHGLSNRAVAEVLEISTKAVEKYVTAIFSKLGLIDHRQLNRRVVASLMFLRDRSGNPGPAPGSSGTNGNESAGLGPAGPPNGG